MKPLKHIVLGILAIGSLAMYPSCKSGSGNSGTAPIDLKMNFKSGDKYIYTTKINQNIGMMEGMTMNQNMTMEMLYACTGDNAGNKNLDITYQHILMEMNGPMGVMKYDSKEPSKREASGFDIMDSLIGKSFGLTVAPNGNIISVNGLDKLLQAFSGGDAKMQAGIKNQLSDTGVRMMMQNSFDMYPGHAVKVGDTWNKKTQMTFSGIDVNVDNTYTLTSVQDGKANLTLSSLLELPKTSMENSPGGTQMELSGKQDGNIEIEIASGQVISSKINSDIKGKMTMGGAPQNISIKGVINVNSNKQ
jgi:hypothetical protein